jgi:hypothetical protein
VRALQLETISLTHNAGSRDKSKLQRSPQEKSESNMKISRHTNIEDIVRIVERCKV